MSRGFGSTFGAGTTDFVETRQTVALKTFSYFTWFLRNGAGGGSLGRLFDQNLGATSGCDVQDNTGSSANQMAMTVGFSTATGKWHWPVTFDTVWHSILVTYDGSSTANNPSVWLDGVSLTVTQDLTPTGSIGTSAGNLYIGNSAGGTRNWDGMISHSTVWNGVLLGQTEASILASGIHPMMVKPDSIILCLPLDGANKPEPDLILGNSVAITGTRLGTSMPSVMSTPQLYYDQNFDEHMPYLASLFQTNTAYVSGWM